MIVTIISIVSTSAKAACTDTDADGWCDYVDNCINNYNPDQGDMDGDQLGDMCDTCPFNSTVTCQSNITKAVWNAGGPEVNQTFIGDGGLPNGTAIETSNYQNMTVRWWNMTPCTLVFGNASITGNMNIQFWNGTIGATTGLQQGGGWYVGTLDNPTSAGNISLSVVLNVSIMSAIGIANTRAYQCTSGVCAPMTTVNAVAKDLAGGVCSSSDGFCRFNVTISVPLGGNSTLVRIVPRLQIESPENKTYYYGDNVSLNFSCAKNVMSDACTQSYNNGTSGAPNITFTSELNLTDLPIGSYTFTFYGNNTKGKTSINTTSVTFSVITAPEPPVNYNCTPPSSGMWYINCSTYCVWKTNKNIPGNITIIGSGVMYLNSIWKFTSVKPYLYINDGCRLIIGKRGKFR